MTTRRSPSKRSTKKRKGGKRHAKSATMASELAERAQAAYQSGRGSEAQALWKQLLERDTLDPDEALAARFWYGTSLHGIGRFEEALRVLDPPCFDPQALGTSPHWVYRIATRAALVHIECASPLPRIERLLERITELAPHAHDERRSRLWVVRGRLEAARGRRAAAVSALQRGLATSRHARHGFAATAPYRMMLPLLLDLGRLTEAGQALDRWRRSGDPDSFKHPHLAAFGADRLRARGELDAARRHAMFAVERAQGIEDLNGTLNALCSLARAAVLAGDVRQTRMAIRRIHGMRRRAPKEDRFRLALATVDAYLGLACLHAGLPVPDPQFGGEFAPGVEGAQRRIEPAAGAEGAERRTDPSAAPRALAAALRACRRAQRSARALDEIFETRFRQSSLRRRRQRLDQLRKRLARRAPSSPRQPLREARSAPSVARSDATPTSPLPATPSASGLPVSLECDGARSRLVTPTEGLADLGRAARKSDHIRFVPHPAKSDGSLGFDLWLRDELMGSGRLSTISEPAPAAGRAIIEVDAAPTPAWLERLARRARRLESERCFTRGQTALAAGRVDEAAQQFGLASELRPEWSAAWEASARSQLARGSAEAALESSLRALEADSTASAPWLTLARIFEATDRTQEAHAAEEQARIRAQAVDGEQEHPEQGSLPF